MIKLKQTTGTYTAQAPHTGNLRTRNWDSGETWDDDPTLIWDSALTVGMIGQKAMTATYSTGKQTTTTFTTLRQKTGNATVVWDNGLTDWDLTLTVWDRGVAGGWVKVKQES